LAASAMHSRVNAVENNTDCAVCFIQNRNKKCPLIHYNIKISVFVTVKKCTPLK